MEVKAKARFIRISPRKVRLVVDLVRNLEIPRAENQLTFSKKAAAVPVLKLLKSAVANAENNFGLKKDNLYIKEIAADDGPTLHRWRPRAHGRAGKIRKRMTHISIILGEKVETKKVEKKAEQPKKVEKTETKRPAAKKTAKSKTEKKVAKKAPAKKAPAKPKTDKKSEKKSVEK